MVISPDGKVLSHDEEGELCAAGPNIMIGYHNNPQATAEAFITIGDKKFFKTGDLAKIKADGTVRLVGRVKEQYKLTNGNQKKKTFYLCSSFFFLSSFLQNRKICGAWTN